MLLPFKDIESTNNTQKLCFTNNKDNVLTPTLQNIKTVKYFSPQCKLTHYKSSTNVNNNTSANIKNERKLPKIKLKDLLTKYTNEHKQFNSHNEILSSSNEEQELFNLKLKLHPSKQLPFYKRKQHKISHLQLPRLIKHLNSNSLLQKEKTQLQQIRNQNKLTLQKYINNNIKHTQYNVITSLKELKQIRENINKKYEYITNHLANYKSLDNI